MRILILSQYYKPEPITKPHELAESLQERGHQVTVITGFPNYPNGKIYPGYRLRPWSIQRVSGVRVIRLPLYPDHSRSALRRILNYCSFAVVASLLAPLLVGRVDVMYVRHPPLTLGLTSFVVGLLKRVRFLYDVQDLWPESIVATGMLKDTWLVSVLRRIERFVYSRAGVIGVASPGFIDNLLGKGVPRDKIHILTNWADEAVYWPVSPDPATAAEMGMAGKFNIVFGGHMSIYEGLDTVLQAADLMRGETDIQFVLAGDGVERPRLEAEALQRGLTNVRFLGRVSPAKMRCIYGLSDILLVHLKAGFLSSTSVPGKTYAYMACAKPVLMAVDGSAADLVERTGAGIACTPEDPVLMAEAVRKLRNMSLNERRVAGAAGRRAFLKDYSRTVGVTLHERALITLAGSSRG